MQGRKAGRYKEAKRQRVSLGSKLTVVSWPSHVRSEARWWPVRALYALSQNRK